MAFNLFEEWVASIIVVVFLGCDGHTCLMGGQGYSTDRDGTYTRLSLTVTLRLQGLDSRLMARLHNFHLKLL
jgi:hypothetical protein